MNRKISCVCLPTRKFSFRVAKLNPNKARMEESIEIEDLPIELLSIIFHYLNPGDRKQAALVNRRWLSVARDSHFHGHLRIIACEIDFQKPPLALFSGSNFPFHRILFKFVHKFQESNLYWLDVSPTVTEIELNECQNVTNVEFRLLLKNFSNLRRLRIVGRHELDETHKISLRLDRVADLDIKYTNFTVTGVTRLLECFPKLERLHLSSRTFRNRKDSDSSDALIMLDLFQNLAPLVPRIIFDEDDILSMHSHLLKDFAAIPNLEFQELFLCRRMQLPHFAAFVQMKSIRSLLTYDELGPNLDQYVSLINQYLVDLRELNIHIAWTLQDSILTRFSNLKQLEKLSIRLFTNHPVQVTDQVQSFPRLKSLELSGSVNLDFFPMDQLTKSCPNLISLRIGPVYIDDDAVQIVFRNCRLLRELSLISQPHITDKGMTGRTAEGEIWRNGHSIADLKGLQKLALYGLSITDFSFESAFKLLELRHFDASNLLHVTEKGIIALVENCPSLETLYQKQFNGSFNSNVTIKKVKEIGKRLRDVSIFYSEY